VGKVEQNNTIAINLIKENQKSQKENQKSQKANL
jgi:hypothetical protein